jgi:isopenicillin N synthase-like dioxygenase
VRKNGDLDEIHMKFSENVNIDDSLRTPMPNSTVPVIDIERLDNPDTLEALDGACKDWGFFQVCNHGINVHTSDEMHHFMRAFFDQPQSLKQKITRNRDNPWGFYDRELTKNIRDWKQVFDFGPDDGQGLAPRWPIDLPGFKRAMEGYYSECEKLSHRLLAAISTNLGMPAEHLRQSFVPRHSSFLRLNYYPICPPGTVDADNATATDAPLGVNQHTDAGVLTVLAQDGQAGLEVQKDGEWHLVEAREDALVINIGDIVQVWSNDIYKAALHRAVTNPHHARFSAPFFFNPDYSATYAPLSSVLKSGQSARYREINWGEFRSLRADGDYADYGEEVQIEHYSIGQTEGDSLPS